MEDKKVSRLPLKILPSYLLTFLQKIGKNTTVCRRAFPRHGNISFAQQTVTLSPRPLRERVRERGVKAAFTLAEVLITLGIIGVVAALTMPSLIANTREKQDVVLLKKVYSILSNAFVTAVNENGSPLNWSIPSTSGNNYQASKALAGPFIKQFNILKDCGSRSGCFPSGNIYRFGGNGIWTDPIDTASHRYKIVTADGVSMAFHAYSNVCNSQEGDIKKCGFIYVDIRGPKDKKMIYGKTLFRFIVTADRLIPDGADHVQYSVMESNCLGETAFPGNDCTLWVLTKNDMKYLK